MPDTTEHGRTRPFADVLNDLSKGRTSREASDGLQDLIAAVLNTGRAGTLTLQLKVSKTNSDVAMVEIEDSVTIKPPKPNRAKSIMFVTDDMNLSRTNPIQPTLPLQEVPNDEPSELREANTK